MKVIYPGTFDPFTRGHLDIISRGIRMFGNLTVAIPEKCEKNTYFSLEKRVKMIKETLGVRSRVKVKSYAGLLSGYIENERFNVIIRGLRNINDLNFELQLANINRKLCKDIETIFITATEKNLFISSTSVREIIKRGGDINNLVPEQVKLIIERSEETCH